VAVVSPSAGAAGRYPHRVERARAYLKSLGLRVRLMPNAAGIDRWVSAPAEARAEDIHQAFLDDEVAVVLAAIGGNHSNQLLPFLDYELIRSHPKVFQGYSDITVLHWAFLKHAHLSSFYGPHSSPNSASSRRFFPTPTVFYAPPGSDRSRSSSSPPRSGRTSTSIGGRSRT
jgi:muramoyltetrapeptide carboxypeptidase LdcA involved in peptidoglycan recycling